MDIISGAGEMIRWTISIMWRSGSSIIFPVSTVQQNQGMQLLRCMINHSIGSHVHASIPGWLAQTGPAGCVSTGFSRTLIGQRVPAGLKLSNC